MFKIFHKYLNPHVHDYKLIAVNDEYNNTFPDKSRVTWSMRYYKCECGKRTATATNDYSSTYRLTHRGVDAAVKNWIDSGVVPQKSYDPANAAGFIKPADDDEKEMHPLVNLNKTVQDLCAMMNVIKRDYDLEKKYPRLKTAADNYNKLLDKYKIFESMKAGQDETSE